MDDTDFDVLCDGASPAEARQLRKLLTDWCDGAENSFPVQLVLLTRSQWRGAAKVVCSVNESRELLLAALDERQRQFQETFATFDEATGDRLDALKKIETEDAVKRRESVAAIESQMFKAQAVATMIASDLEKARTSWFAARTEYDTAREKLESAEQQLQARLNLRDWIGFGLMLLMAAVIGAGLTVLFPLSTTVAQP